MRSQEQAFSRDRLALGGVCPTSLHLIRRFVLFRAYLDDAPKFQTDRLNVSCRSSFGVLDRQPTQPVEARRLVANGECYAPDFIRARVDRALRDRADFFDRLDPDVQFVARAKTL